MQRVQKYLMVLTAIICLTGCKQKKKISLSGEETVAVNDFIDFFAPLDLPLQFTDTSLLKTKKENDSLLISLKNFNQFVPDSVLQEVYAKGAKPKIYVLGKISVPKAETYLFVKTITNDKKAVFVLGFDKEQQFIAGMPVLRPDLKSATEQSISMDRKYSITKKVVLKNTDGSLSEGRDVYVLNNEAKNFMLIMTDALDDKITELINPIDTLPRKNKYSADYSNGKMNLVAIRDGRKDGKISFFIHFEKNNGACTGELKGEASMKTPNTAVYQVDGDPCQLQFIFSSSAVTLKEIEGCGSRRGLNCAFDGSFAKKKVSKSVNKSK
ncbi:MAG: hypothetical protein IPH34_11795 [Chitinophagaceae bacterium]|nr:hypothetical protein [Chitinophagaceae bacterium]MBP7108460.1 hypothetical protein [Chitinophagaceae bacterium]MBP7314399.1 hypothetical protein [Chitinophagaceae bacterium]